MFREVLFERVWRAQALRFLRAEQGASTIEFVIWVPVFALLLGLVADAALIYGGQARILRVVQDGNRAMSIGRVTDTNTLEKPDRHATAAAEPACRGVDDGCRRRHQQQCYRAPERSDGDRACRCI